MGKKATPNDVLGTKLRISAGYTTCANCNRSMREQDVDAEGYCPDETCQTVKQARSRPEAK